MAQAIKIHPWLEEVGQGLKVVEGHTFATYTATVRAYGEHKRLFALKQLEKWASDTYSLGGIEITNLSLEYQNPGRYDTFGNYCELAKNDEPAWQKPREYIKLTLEIGLTFSGQVDISGFNPEVGVSVSGGVKKALALRTVAQYPLPFGETLGAIDRLTYDSLVVLNKNYRPRMNQNVPTNFAGGIDSMLPILRKILQNYPVRLGLVTSQTEGTVIIQAVWSESVLDVERQAALAHLKQAFKDDFSEYTVPPTEAHFMIW